MRYPDDVIILRASGTDEYGNPGASWDSPIEIPAKAFVRPAKAYFPPKTDLLPGDRLLVNDEVFAMDTSFVRSPTRMIMRTAVLTPFGRGE